VHAEIGEPLVTVALSGHALERNLAALGARHADLAARLRSLPPRDDLILHDTSEGVPAGVLAGRALCSRHRPLEEASRLAATVDVIEHAVIVVLGFGLGYHVRALAERIGRAGVIVVFEPDAALLRSVFEHVDHAAWLRESLVVWVTDGDDRGALARGLEGAEAILAQGVAILEHPPSRPRLGAAASAFAAQFSDYVQAAKTTLMTTLMRSADTVRNLALNLDHYAAGAGVAELKNSARGCAAVVVSAGPSLQRNLRLLAPTAPTGPGPRSEPRDRCVIIAVQTTLKPLLAAGIRPHFVTALDYHEISRRFYEGLTAPDIAGVTLVADPKAHPSIIDSFPGSVRCCASPVLDELLGPLRREMGTLPDGATVAHLGLYLARHLGCDPVILIGQDLGFSDGLYYAPGTAIHEVWAPELNPFNTIEMMEWQRIARHRTHLQRLTDVHGRAIHTDMQMLTYLRQFERDGARDAADGATIIDATEGGVTKQHMMRMPLAEALGRYAVKPAPAIPPAAAALDADRLTAAAARLKDVTREIEAIGRTSREAAALLQRMIADQADPGRMDRHFREMDRHRRAIEDRFQVFQTLQHVNQLGVFKRLKADRRLHMQPDLDPVARQRAQIDRDLENVTWTADAADEMRSQLEDAQRVLRGERIMPRPARRPAETPDAAASSTAGAAARAPAVSFDSVASPASPARMAALVPIDPDRNGLGQRRSLTEPFGGRTVLQATLERLGESTLLHEIVLIVPRGFEVEPLLDRPRIGVPVVLERVEGSPYGPEHAAIAAARLWSDWCWRGGIGGAGIYDEVLAPRVMHEIMLRRGHDAALVAAPDWPLVMMAGEGGGDAVLARHLEHRDRHHLVFTQAPPGLGACVVSAGLMGELALGTRLSMIGGLLVYQPHAPQSDPIALEACVPVDHRVRGSLVRATFDSPRRRKVIESALRSVGSSGGPAPAMLVAALEQAERALPPRLPQHIVLELTMTRAGRGLIRRHRPGSPDATMTTATAVRVLDQLRGHDELMSLSLAGLGDPLHHPEFDTVIRAARDAGVHGVHVRTELLSEAPVLDRLLACGVDVISIDLHADRAATYERMMGFDRFREVLVNIDRLVQGRRRLTDHAPAAAMALPWVVPVLQRRAETLDDIESFFDRWQRALGAAVIEPAPPEVGDSLLPTWPPRQVSERAAMRTMTILADGRVPADHQDMMEPEVIGSIHDEPIVAIWERLLNKLEERHA
jgi:hypothetical protein